MATRADGWINGWACEEICSCLSIGVQGMKATEGDGVETPTRELGHYEEGCLRSQ